jgi:hypothetical protein
LVKSGKGGRFGLKDDWGGDLGMLSGRWSGRTGDKEDSNTCGGADIDLRDLRREPLCLGVLGRTGDRMGEEDSAPD